MSRCSTCNAEIPESAKFCPECGAKAPVSSSETCPSCNSPVRAGAKFCSKCGAALGGVAAPEVAENLAGASASSKSHRSIAPVLLPVIIIPALIGIFFLLTYKGENPKPAGVMDQQQAGAPPEGGLQGGGMGMGMEEVFERIDDMKAAVQANPKDTTALFGLGQMYEMASKFDEAEEYYRRYLDVSPNNPDVRMALAGVYFNQQKLDKAEAEMQEAVRRRPNYDFAFYNLGVIYAASQKKDEAIKAWHKVMELSPGSELAQKSATNIKSMTQ